MYLETSKEYGGLWWLPENPENKIEGSLSINENNDILLELNESLEAISENSFNLNNEYKLIYGELNEKQFKITLNNSFVNSIQLHNGKHTIISNRAIIGSDFYDESMKVKSCSSNFTYLDIWISYHAFLTDHFESGEFTFKPNKLGEFSIDYPNCSLVISSSPKVYLSEIFLEKSRSINNNVYGEVENSIEFNFTNSILIEDVIDHIDCFSNFLTLCVGHKNDAYGFRGFDKKNYPFEIIMKWQINKIPSRLSKYDFFLPKFLLLEEKFVEIYNNWYNLYQKAKPTLAYFVELNKDNSFSYPITFQICIQAIEGFSRRILSNDLIDKETHKNRLNDIYKNCPKEHEEFLKNALQYSNQLTLDMHLSQIFKKTSFIGDFAEKFAEKFKDKIKKTRNYFTHFDSKYAERILTLTENFYVTKYLLMIFRILIFQEIGLSDELIREQILTRSPADLSYILDPLGIPINPMSESEPN